MGLWGLRVLVVDDNESVRLSLRNMFQLLGCEVMLAGNGEEGVNKYRRFRPELVLMDLEMPKKNGLSAGQDILKLDPQATILLMTGLPEAELAQRALERRIVKAILPKPFHFGKMRAAIDKALGSSSPLPQRRVVG